MGQVLSSGPGGVPEANYWVVFPVLLRFCFLPDRVSSLRVKLLLWFLSLLGEREGYYGMLQVLLQAARPVPLFNPVGSLCAETGGGMSERRVQRHADPVQV